MKPANILGFLNKRDFTTTFKVTFCALFLRKSINKGWLILQKYATGYSMFLGEGFSTRSYTWHQLLFINHIYCDILIVFDVCLVYKVGTSHPAVLTFSERQGFAYFKLLW